MAKTLGGLDAPVNESQGGTNATTFNTARTNMGLNPLIAEKTLTYLVLTTDRGKLIHYTGAGGVDLTLTAAATLGDGFNFILRNDAAADITINPDGAELINGAATLAVEPGQAVEVYCDAIGFYTTGEATIPVSFPVTLSQGGTNANLTANEGGIFYSTATAGAILAGTATANQMLQSGATAAPAWSTATWPATTTINQILYSSAANTVVGLATGNDGVLITSAAGVPSISTAIPDGVTAANQGALTSDGTLANTQYVDDAVAAAALPGFTAAAVGVPTSLKFYEPTDVGTNYLEVIAPTSISFNATFTLPLVSSGGNCYAVAQTSVSSNGVPTQTNYFPSSSNVTTAGSGYRVGTAPFAVPKVNGHYALPFNSTGRDGAGIAVSNDVIYLTLVYLALGPYTTITFNVITADASNTADVDVAIYLPVSAPDDGVSVGTKLLDGATVSNISATGEHTSAITSTMLAGWYWIALRPDNIGTSLTLDACAGTNVQMFLPSNTTTASIYAYSFNGQTTMPSNLAAYAADAFLGLTDQLHVAVS